MVEVKEREAAGGGGGGGEGGKMGKRDTLQSLRRCSSRRTSCRSSCARRPFEDWPSWVRGGRAGERIRYKNGARAAG